MAKAFKLSLAIGDVVEFFRSHDKATRLKGEIVKVHDGDDDVVDVKFHQDGKLVTAANHIETVHAKDVTVLDKAQAKPVARLADPE